MSSIFFAFSYNPIAPQQVVRTLVHFAWPLEKRRKTMNTYDERAETVLVTRSLYELRRV